MQPHLQQETSIVNPPQPTQGPFLLYDLPPGSFMWNPHSQGYLPQGPVMFEPQQYISYIQILQPQGPCNLNPFPQRPCVCNPHPQGPFMGYSEGQYIHCTRPQIPCMDNPLPQMPLSLDGLYMQNHHPQGDCQYNLAHPWAKLQTEVLSNVPRKPKKARPLHQFFLPPGRCIMCKNLNVHIMIGW